MLTKSEEEQIVREYCKNDEILYGIKFSKEDMNKILSDKNPLSMRIIVSTMKINKR